jgi:prepilin peptidase CpaA
MAQLNQKLFFATLILAVGVVDDLRSRRFPNTHFVGLSAFAVLFVLFHESLWGTALAFASALTAFVITLPLVLMKILGAGDMKLLVAMALLADWRAVICTVVYSIIWGALLGLVHVTIRGQVLLVLRNTIALATRTLRGSDSELHRSPYAVALVFGWISYLSLLEHGGNLI